MIIEKVKYKFVSIVILLVAVIGIIIYHPNTKAQLYKIKIIKAIEVARVKSTIDEIDDTNTVYINSEKGKRVIIDALRNGTCKLWKEGFSTPELQYYMHIGDVNIYYGNDLIGLEGDSLYFFFLEKDDVAEIDNLIKSLE